LASSNPSPGGTQKSSSRTGGIAWPRGARGRRRIRSDLAVVLAEPVHPAEDDLRAQLRFVLHQPYVFSSLKRFTQAPLNPLAVAEARRAVLVRDGVVVDQRVAERPVDDGRGVAVLDAREALPAHSRSTIRWRRRSGGGTSRGPGNEGLANEAHEQPH
jgi:hypothetical protein